MSRTVLPLALLLSLIAGCRGKPEREAVRAEPAPEVLVKAVASAPAVPPEPPPPPAPLPPATVETLPVPGDHDASIVRGTSSAPPTTIFLPGMCSNGAAYLHTFPEAARARGGVVAIEGDAPCGAPNSGFRTFSWDVDKQRTRIEAALEAAGTVANDPLTIIGYSQGASFAEQLARRLPARYARIVIIGAPTDPSPASFAKSRSVVTMSCSADVPARMRNASRAIERAGVPALYLEMPKCTHGNVTEGERIFGEAFSFLDTHAR